MNHWLLSQLKSIDLKSNDRLQNTLKPLLTGSALFAMSLIGMQAVLAADPIQVDQPYARAVPPGQPNSAVFMTLTNQADADRALVSASSDVAEVVELHTHTMDNGMMRMRRIDQIDLPAGEAVVLEPGGLHVMLIGLKRQLVPGEQVTLELRYDDGSSEQLSAPVKAIQPMGRMHGHGM